MNRRESTATKNGDSINVVLPADWVRGNKVRPGDKVLVEYGGDEVIVRPLAPPRGKP